MAKEILIDIPEISILMPYKNASIWLVDCLVSIQHQSFQNWEVIGVNDSSTDESEAIFLEFQEKDSRFKTFKNEGQGIIAALDFAFQKSNGKLISRMDADDLMPEKRLEQMQNLLLDCPEKTVVTGLVQYFSDLPISAGYQSYETWINETNLKGLQTENIFRECVIASPNWLTNREVMDSIGGFGDLKYPEDYDLVLKWYDIRVNFKVVPEVTLFWREHPNRTSRNSKNYTQEAFFELKINAFLRLDYLQNQLIIWGKNPKSRMISKILEARGIPFENHDLKDFRKVEKIQKPQILLAVYPFEKERKLIQNYLFFLDLQEGMDWWWV